MSFTIRELNHGWRAHVLAAIAFGLFLSFLGPFKSAEVMSPGPRTLYWLSLVGTGYLFALAATRLIGARPRPIVARALSIAALSTVPEMFIVSWALVQVRPGRVIALSDLPMLFVAVLSIQAVIVAIQAWLRARASHDVQGDAGVADGNRPIHGRIAQSLRGTLFALESEDHYVRVHDQSGSSLVLHRLSDAIAELGSTDGLQVHRSWWVATAAVDGTFLRGGKRWLRLCNGLEVPVSRTYLRSVVERGWPRLSPTAAASS